MKVQPAKIVQYGKRGFSAFQTGRRLCSLAKATVFRSKAKATKAVQKQVKKEKWQQRRKDWRKDWGIFGKRLSLLFSFAVAVKGRYF